MTDNRDSPTTSDPRSSLHQFSNRQDSAFQYGDPAKRSATTSAKDTDESTKETSVKIFQDDPYDEEEADKKFLESKPSCFLLLGRPGVGKTNLARKLADDWRAELINIADLITTNIKQKTELGMHARDLLLRGEAVPDQMVARMLDIKMRSAEVAHHGYVFDGFPLMDEQFMKLSDQMESMKNWPLKPDYVINIRIPDEDLINRRKGQKIDPTTGLLYVKEQYAPTPPEKAPAKPKSDDDEESDGEDGDDDEENNDEAEEEEQPVDEFFAPVPSEIVDRLVTRPEDMSPDVADSIKTYRDQLLRSFEEYMASLPQSYLIELDGNMSPTYLFEQLLERLNAYPIRRAARVERFFPPEVEEEEEMGQDGTEMEEEEGEEGEKAVRAEESAPVDEMETEELLLSLAGSNPLSNKYKWHRSRWLRLDPVTLKQGNRVPGRQDLAVHFMDKIFVLSSKDSLKEFQKNPRRYVTQLRSPCKLFLYGPRLSGVEQLAQDLAKKYGATVIDMKSFAQPKVDELRQKYLESIRADMERVTIERLQQQQEVEIAEKLARDQKAKEEEDERRKEAEASNLEDDETTMEPNDLEEGEKARPTDEEENRKTPPADGEAPVLPPPAAASPTIQAPDEDLRGLGPEDAQTQVEPIGPITAEHPEVKKAVEKAVEEARNAALTIPADVYAELMHKAIENVEKEQRDKNPQGPLFGNWIFVNFPYENDIWSTLNEKNIQPDDVVIVQDGSSQLEALQKRWYKANRTEIDREIRERKEREANEQRIRAEEEKRKLEEMKLKVERDRNERLAERQRRIEAGETLDDEDEEAENEMAQKILDDQKYEPKKEDFIDKIPETIPEEDESVSKDLDKDKSSNADLSRAAPSVSPLSPDEEVLPPTGVEQQTFVDQARADVNRINELIKNISNLYNIEPILIDLNKENGDKMKTADEMTQEAYDALEKQYKYSALESENTEEEVDEEEEGEGEEEEQEEDEDEGEEEQVDLFKKDRKKHLGDTSIYDPVGLVEKNVLLPGKPDFVAVYRGQTYRFATEDNRASFLQTPLKYLPIDRAPKLPSIRVIFLGPEGVGKSLHGRDLAKKCDLFHIKFRERLQEMIVGKTKMKIGPEYSEGRDEPNDEEEDNQESKPTDETEELTADEENIKAYLQDGEPLSNEILDRIVKPWWTEEPYRSRGFVLEGFPSTEDETAYLVENQFLPDVVVQLDAEPSAISPRILPIRMEQWTKKMNLRKEKRTKSKGKKDRDKKKAMDERRAELMLKRQQSIEAGETVEEDDIEQILASEFQQDDEEEEAIPEDEDPETARGRINEMIEQQVNDVKEKLEGVKKVFQEEFVPFLMVNAGDKPRYVKNRLTKKLERFIQLRENLFERVYPIKPQLAQKLIDNGYLHYSKFGKFCPVSLFNGNCFPPVYETEKNIRTVLYRKNIYYLADEEAKNEFIKNPLKYVRQPPPKSLIPAKIAVVGPPKSGKTTVVKRLLKEIGCVRISLGDAIRFVLEKQRRTVLGSELQNLLLKGQEVPAETAVRCLEIILMNAKCQTRGFILDGFPLTKKHVELLSEKGIIPFKLFELECDLTESIRRAMADRIDPNRQYPAPDSPEAISFRYAIYQNEIAPVKKWYVDEHKNWMSINGKNNRWIVWDKIAQETANVTKKIQNYIERKSLNKAASIADLCILPQELLNRLGEFEHFCPVSLVLRDELVDCSATTRTDYVAEYRGQYYRMAGPKELELFLEDPEKYAPLEPKKLPPPPNRRPHRRTAAEVKALAPKPVEFAGYCPVTYLDGGKRYECLVLGQQDFAVEYRDKLYLLFNEETREKFLRQPEKYWNLRLPHKLPPPKTPIDLLNLPSLGYLEQTVSNAIIKSLTSTGNFKPKFPFLSLRTSALIYMAYHLKAYNTKSSDYLRRKFRRKLYIFEEQCELIGYLAEKTTIRYKELSQRTPEYNVKYETFFALQQNSPTLNWLT